MLPRDLGGRCSVVGELAGQKMIEGGAQTVNVGAVVERFAGQLFRTDILRRAHDFIAVGLAGFVADFRQTQVGQLGTARGGQHDVVGLDVSVHQFLFLPRIIQRFRDLADDVDRLVQLQNALAFEDVVHRLAVDMFHREIENAVVIADGVSLDDVGMIQFGGGTRLLDEPDHELGVFRIGIGKDLQRGGTVQRNLVRQIHDPHAAASDLMQNDEISDHTARGGPGSRNCHRLIAMNALDGRTHGGIVDRHYAFAAGTLKTHHCLSCIFKSILIFMFFS